MLVLLVAALGVGSAFAQAPVITTFRTDGTLIWSNPAAVGNSIIDRSAQVSGGWLDVLTLPNTSLVASAQLALTPPAGFFRVRFSTNAVEPPPVEVVYVAQGATGAGDGTTWADAYTNVQEGIAGAAASNQVWVREGLYAIAGPVALKPNLELYGGFAGSESALDQRDWAARPTIMHGGGGPGFAGAHGARLDGFWLTGCGGAGDGSVLAAFQTSPSVYNCIVSNNTGGAAFYFQQHGDATSAQAVVRNCLFVDNIGGAIRYWGRTNEGRAGPHLLTVDRCTFRNNTRDGTGGAIDSDYAGDWLKIYNSVFERNAAVTGGALHLRNGLKTYIPVYHCTFVDNVASNVGHAVYIAHHFSDGVPGLVDMLNCVIRGGDSNAVTLTGHRDFPSQFRVGFSDLQNGLASVAWSPANVAGVADLGGIIADDPLFAGADDFHLQTGSPCINVGTNGLPAELDVDRDGLTRPVGAGPDMGAYEYRP